jgi:tryptophan synthase beta chain
MPQQARYLLAAEDIPREWYNLAADLPSLPPPPLNPGTSQPVGPDDLTPIFPMALIGQEVSGDRWVPIPDAVREVYAMWRPTPLHRAHRLEAELGTTCRIFYKYEGGSPAGSHKPNTSVPQAFFNAREGVRRLATETGAGQWARRCPSPASSSGSSARSTWCACPTTASRTGAR